MRATNAVTTWAVLVAAAVAMAGPRVPARTLAEVKLLYFHLPGCASCNALDASGVLAQVKAELPGLTVERVDVPTRPELVERYHVEVTPTLVLVDAAGFPLGRAAVELKDPDRTRANVVRLVRRMARVP